MKTWFAQLRLSAARDAGRPIPASLRHALAHSEPLRRFEREMTALDSALRTAPAKPGAPSTLHHSIMRAIRDVNCPTVPGRQPAVWRWLPAAAAAALTVLAAWWTVQHGRHEPAPHAAGPAASLAAATTALEMGREMTRVVPSAAVAPLADELARVNRDVDNTAQFLLASLP